MQKSLWKWPKDDDFMSFYMYFWFFLRCVALFYHVLQFLHPYYASHNIVPKIWFRNLSVLCVKTQFSIVFNYSWSFSIISSKYWSKTSFSCQLPIFRAENWTGPDLWTLLLGVGSQLVFAGPVWSGFLTQKWAMGNCNQLPNLEISKNRDHNQLKLV